MFLKSFILLCISVAISNSEVILKQVVILSRHNVRTPLAKNLAMMTPKIWPTWKEKRGYLTSKGELLEGFMGEYFSLWLRKEGVLAELCPTEDVFFAYANTAQRTMASAKAFVRKGFPSCNITVYHKEDKDPIFDPIVHNDSTVFRQQVLEEMQLHLRSLVLNHSYETLENILDYKKSNCCEIDNKCDLVTDKNQAFVSFGTKPYLSGPLKLSKSAIDSFIMENYEGFPLNEVAWGQLWNMNQWNGIIALSRGYHDVIFNTTLISKDISKPLRDYIKELFINETNIPKVVFIMGHDANLYTLLNSMGVKPYNLKGQYEKVPVGGKVVFQKWFDTQNSTFYMKIDYVYQNTQGMREGLRLSMENPPEFTLLELHGCKINDEGFCLWDDFKKLLNTL